MILVDDGLAVRALAGQVGAYRHGEVPTVAWGFYIRLLTALHVIEGNVSTNWEVLCDMEGVELRIIPVSA